MRRGWLAVGALLAAVLLALAGCGAAEPRWRDVRWKEAGLRIALPCRPSQTEREVTLAGEAVTMRMQGCQHRRVMYVVAMAPLAHAERAGQALAQWRAASADSFALRTDEATVASHPDADPPVGAAWQHPQAFRPAGALNIPQSLWAHGVGVDVATGTPLQVQAAWFAALRGDTALVYAAIRYEPRPPQPASSPSPHPFFEGLALL